MHRRISGDVPKNPYNCRFLIFVEPIFTTMPDLAVTGITIDMGASNTPLYDLIELQGLLDNTTYTTTPGGGGDIIGYVDNATYTDKESVNSATQINELNETYDSDNGVLTIDGVDYVIYLVTPTNSSNPVTVTYNDGASTIDLTGDDYRSQVAFIIAEPIGGGSTRWFMAVDDSVGDLPGITSIQTRNLDWNPSGDDVKITLHSDNNITVCFAAGTLIETETGPRPAEEIRPGCRLLTLDRGPRPVLWRHTQTLHFAPGGDPRQRPVRIQRGALGPGIPERTLLVSPQHRMLVASKISARLLGAPEVLVPAVRLVGLAGIARDETTQAVTYVHLYLGSHEVILAEGAPSESLLPEREALRALPPAARRELTALARDPVRAARPIVEFGPILRELLRRHRKNAKPLCDPSALSRARAAAERPAPRLVREA